MVFNSVAKYGLQTLVNKYIAVTILSAYSTIVPVLTALFEYLDPNDRPKFDLSYLGCLPIVAGLALVTMQKAERAAQGAAAEGAAGEKAYP